MSDTNSADEKQALRNAMIAALENLQTAHVSLACPDCAEDAWDFVVEHLSAMGYRIVPVEPTEAMWAAGGDIIHARTGSNKNGANAHALAAWRAMVGAAGR
jgi:hypothetical protein